MQIDGTASPLRCAIYTRQSTNKRLEHDVNSLMTQREICSAYVKSQRYKGWVEMPEHYDDGGHSGSGLDRPALASIMQDIEDGKIDVVVVYKIDRLTRSLLDFVRLIEIFDRRNTSLVSISQAFDTSDSMGRMILNILLTFSQFERELIAERVRDSIRTRKKHGKVHGGLPPFGYVSTRKGLEIEPTEAKIVRFIFAEFLRTERYSQVMAIVREKGLRTTTKYTKQGAPRGGRKMSPGLVYGILRNPIYVGEIRGHHRNYEGEHKPIISRETWESATKIGEQRRRKKPGSKDTGHFLASLLRDDLGRHMLLDLNWHRGKTYCAYVSSNAMWSQKEFRRQYRANAIQLDRLITATVAAFLNDRKVVRKALKELGVYGEELDALAEKGRAAARRLKSTPLGKMEALFKALICWIEIGEEEVSIMFRSLELRRFLEWDDNSEFRGRPADWPCSDAKFEHSIAVRAITAERWPSLHILPQDPSRKARPDQRLVDLVRSARRAQNLVEEHRDWSLEELAKKQKCRPTHFARLIRLNYLAPDIVTAILDGTQPEGLDRKTLLMSNVPTDWVLQRELYGFPAPVRKIAPRNLYGRGLWPHTK